MFVDGYLFSSNLWYIRESVPLSLEKYLILFSSALQLITKKIKMKNLIIDAAGEKILFKIIIKKESFSTIHSNSRDNFDKFVILLFDFLQENNIKIEDINNSFVNLGPGKLSSIRSSIAIAKGLGISKKIPIYGFCTKQISNNNYNKLFELLNNGDLIKNLLKPKYKS